MQCYNSPFSIEDKSLLEERSNMKCNSCWKGLLALNKDCILLQQTNKLLFCKFTLYFLFNVPFRNWEVFFLWRQKWSVRNSSTVVFVQFFWPNTKSAKQSEEEECRRYMLMSSSFKVSLPVQRLYFILLQTPWQNCVSKYRKFWFWTSSQLSPPPP